jgi:hypothetical protein
MGVFTASGETAFAFPAEEIYDFVSNPNNWPKTFRGSADIDTPLELPLKVGDTWSEVVKVGESFTCLSEWQLITAERPRKWVFQQVDGIGQAPDRTGGLAGITTISYTFSSPGEGVTLFHRSIHCELPHGVRIPDELLLARAQPANIENYHAAVARELAAAR